MYNCMVASGPLFLLFGIVEGDISPFSGTDAEEKDLADALWYKLTPIGSAQGMILADVNKAVPESKLSFVDPQNRPASEANGVTTMSKIENDPTESQHEDFLK